MPSPYLRYAQPRSESSLRHARSEYEENKTQAKIRYLSLVWIGEHGRLMYGFAHMR